jgi:hypothetical protein
VNDANRRAGLEDTQLEAIFLALLGAAPLDADHPVFDFTRSMDWGDLEALTLFLGRSLVAERARRIQDEQGVDEAEARRLVVEAERALAARCSAALVDAAQELAEEAQ